MQDEQNRVRVRVQAHPEEDFMQYIFSAPRNGFMGFVKGFSLGFAVLGAMDFLYLIKFTGENKFFHQGMCLALAFFGMAWGLHNESCQPIRIFINEHNASLRERIGIFWERAQAMRAPRTGAEGLAKGFLFSLMLMIFSEPYLSLKNAMKFVLVVTALTGALGFTNESRGLRNN